MSAPNVSDAAVRHATGRGWSDWFEWLDEHGGRDLGHGMLVATLADAVDSQWWRQTIAGGYEQAVRGRARHEMPDGFQASASKTVGVPVSRVWRALEHYARAAWFPPGKLEVTTERPRKALRGRWVGPSGAEAHLDLMLTTKPGGKTLVQVNISKLPDASACETEKNAWRNALAALAYACVGV